MSKPIHRFVVVPHQYNGQAAPKFYHCCTKRQWQTFITPYFSDFLSLSELAFDHTISNASFRLSALEVKIGLLLADDEARTPRQTPAEIGLLSGAVRPGLVIDCVLAMYSIFEGLGTLSKIAHTPREHRQKFLAANNSNEKQIKKVKLARKNQIAKGVEAVTGTRCNQELSSLTKLRDRCIHQDCADLQGDLDYEHVFETNALYKSVELLCQFLLAMRSDDRSIPQSNLLEFSRVQT